MAKFTFDDILGNSVSIRQTIHLAKQYSKTDANILITGETGTGKELFAQSIHNASNRFREPFVALNCAVLSENLLESELFGYVEGAFTDARKGGKSGLFEAAHNGTLFLDEISEISPRMQGILLRVLQEHVEVQIIGDEYGNIVHLFERDCSIQRRHQKVVEIAPAFSLPASVRQGLCNAALQIMNNVKYVNAGTVEFLVTPDNNFYFIEVNPRVQVEHTITEMITGIDVVQTQIKIAEGYALDSDEIGIRGQESVQCRGNAIQCRITTEDPMNNFMPDSGKLMMNLVIDGIYPLVDPRITLQKRKGE